MVRTLHLPASLQSPSLLRRALKVGLLRFLSSYSQNHLFVLCAPYVEFFPDFYKKLYSLLYNILPYVIRCFCLFVFMTLKNPQVPPCVLNLLSSLWNLNLLNGKPTLSGLIFTYTFLFSTSRYFWVAVCELSLNIFISLPVFSLL